MRFERRIAGSARRALAGRPPEQHNAVMSTTTSALPGTGICWCCGRPTDPGRMARLGAHPEVTVCAPCARSLGRAAQAASDGTSRTLPARVRRASLDVRGFVVRHEWHRRGVLGHILRWSGRHLP